jgi:hypothetical protein
MSIKKVGADKIYYDILISNLDTSTTIPPPLYFNEARTIPFLDNPEDYYLSIIRFSLETGSIIPVIIPEIQVNQPNINLTVYSFTLAWDSGATLYNGPQTFVQFVPQNRLANLPAAPSITTDKLQDNSTGYYSVFQIQYFLYLVNIALATAYTDLNNLVVAGGDVLPSAYAPVITYDSGSKIFILNCDVAGYSSALALPIKMYMNPSMYNLFGSLPVYINSATGGGFGKQFEIQTDTFGGSTLTQFPPSAPVYTAIQVFQETSSIPTWSPVTSIVFCSSTLPIIPTQVSAPQIFINGTTISNSNNSNISPVITDIVADDAQYTPFLVYNPTAEYRLISLTGNKSLFNVDISVFYKDRIGVLVPLRLPSGGSCTLKLLFTKKTSDSKR